MSDTNVQDNKDAVTPVTAEAKTEEVKAVDASTQEAKVEEKTV